MRFIGRDVRNGIHNIEFKGRDAKNGNNNMQFKGRDAKYGIWYIEFKGRDAINRVSTFEFDLMSHGSTFLPSTNHVFRLTSFVYRLNRIYLYI